MCVRACMLVCVCLANKLLLEKFCRLGTILNRNICYIYIYHIKKSKYKINYIIFKNDKIILLTMMFPDHEPSSFE